MSDGIRERNDVNIPISQSPMENSLVVDGVAFCSVYAISNFGVSEFRTLTIIILQNVLPGSIGQCEAKEYWTTILPSPNCDSS